MMAFYMVVYGLIEIEDIYVGRTKKEAVTNARPLINCWPEYAALSDEKIMELLKYDGELEFEIVRIKEYLPTKGFTWEKLIDLYHKYVSSPRSPLSTFNFQLSTSSRKDENN